MANGVGGLVQQAEVGLATWALRLVALVWVPASVVFNGFGIVGALDHLGWGGHQAVASLGTVYNTYQATVGTWLVPAQAWAEKAFNLNLPALKDGVALYASSASALALGSLSSTAKRELVQQTMGGLSALTWPLAVFGLLGQAFQSGFVRGFARDHTVLFLGYLGLSVATAGGIIGFAPQLAKLLPH